MNRSTLRTAKWQHQNTVRIFAPVAFLILMMACITGLHAQWTVKNPFEPKVFVENKGQYSLEGIEKGKDVRFGAIQDGLRYYFTSNSIRVHHIRVTKSQNEGSGEKNSPFRLGKNHSGEEETEESNLKQKDELHLMEFENVNPGVRITPEEETPCVFTYGQKNHSTIKAHAWKRLVYRNLYPKIDMIVEFPEDTTGFKYSFKIYPGGDPSQIEINYGLSEKTEIDQLGNVIIHSSYGNFVDHAPLATEDGSGKNVKCSFRVKMGSVSFNTVAYDQSQVLIIDPWTVTPNFPGSKAFDVDFDNAGNCYAYGGQPPFQLIKFNPSGTPVYNFTTSLFVTGGGGTTYGDFAIDRVSGSAYIVDGYNVATGSMVVKLDPAGNQSAVFNGNMQFNEMWRISFSRCTNEAVIAGGGTTNPSYTGCYLDTNLTNLHPVNILNSPTGLHDMWGLVLDNSSNAYFLSTKTFSGTPGFDNLLFKVPLPSLSPVTWQVPSGYNFLEGHSVVYTPAYANGYNGTTMSGNNLYTYDSYVLKKWNTTNGALISSASINGTSQVPVYYGGLTADDCNHIFLGFHKNIVEYDGNSMTQLNSVAAADTIYDMNLSNRGMLYVCGKGFVSTVQLTLPSCGVLQVTNTVNNPGCTTPTGSASVTVTGGTGPYTYSWNTNPVQTGSTATNLAPGTYIVSIRDASCTVATKYDTITITQNGGFSVTVNNLDVSCQGENNGTADAIVSAGAVAPITYTWSPTPGNGQGTAHASGFSPGTYTLVVHDGAGCMAQRTFTINPPSNANPVPAVSSLPVTNVFTPNGDNDNEGFEPFSSTPASLLNLVMDSYDLKVYDRWGVQMFHTNQFQDYWNGRTSSGSPADPGTYFWIVSYKAKCNLDESSHEIKGFVQLIR